jgi:hypothetical protein
VPKMRRQRAMMRRTAAGKLAARLGVFAILFQAVLFGWHHHDLAFGSRHQSPVIHNSTAATHPVDDEDGCEICQVLHHQTAAASNAIVTPLPGLTVSPSIAADPAFIARTLALAFRARAPPLV